MGGISGIYKSAVLVARSLLGAGAVLVTTLALGVGFAFAETQPQKTITERELQRIENKARDEVAACQASASKRVSDFLAEPCGCDEAEKQKRTQEAQKAGDEQKAICSIRGEDEILSFIAQEKNSYLAHLRVLKQQFTTQADSYASWGKEAEHGIDAASEKIETLLLFSVATTALMDLGLKQLEEVIQRRLDVMVQRVEKMKDPRNIRRWDLKWVVSFWRGTLQRRPGETKEATTKRARDVVLAELAAAKRATQDLSASAGGVIDYSQRHMIKGGPEVFSETEREKELRNDFPWLIATTQTAYNQWPKLFSISERSMGIAAGGLALAPDMIDTGALLVDALVTMPKNLSSLEQLHRAAEQERAALGPGLEVLIAKRHQIESEKKALEKSIGK